MHKIKQQWLLHMPGIKAPLHSAGACVLYNSSMQILFTFSPSWPGLPGKPRSPGEPCKKEKITLLIKMFKLQKFGVNYLA